MHINCSFQIEYFIIKCGKIKDFITIQMKISQKKRRSHHKCVRLFVIFIVLRQKKNFFMLYIFFVFSARIALRIAITATPTSANTAHHIVA